MSMETLGSLSYLFTFIHFDMTAAKLFDYVMYYIHNDFLKNLR